MNLCIDDDTIEEALVNAAGSGKPTGMTWEKTAVTSQQRIDSARQIIRRFVELLDDDVTVADIREAIGGIPR